MKIIFIQTGKTTSAYISEGVSDFTSRIKKYAGFEIITIPDLKNTKNMPPYLQVERECRSIMQQVNNEDFVIALDEAGAHLSTREFAERIQKIFLMSKKRLLFITGGAWGLADEVKTRSDMVLSLSRLTFSHQLVRLLFAEQLYRALSVINGDPYHHD